MYFSATGKNKTNPGTVVHICNHSYTWGGGRRIGFWGWPQAKTRPYMKNLTNKNVAVYQVPTKIIFRMAFMS
jgi:hypothetical protein